MRATQRNMSRKAYEPTHHKKEEKTMSKLTIENPDGSTADYEIPNGTDAQSITIDGVKLSTVVGLRTGLRRQMWVLAVSAATFCVSCVAILSIWTHEQYGTPNNTKDAVVSALTEQNKRLAKHIESSIGKRVLTPDSLFKVGDRVRSKPGKKTISYGQGWNGRVVNAWYVSGGRSVVFPEKTFSIANEYTGWVYDIQLYAPRLHLEFQNERNAEWKKYLEQAEDPMEREAWHADYVKLFERRECSKLLGWIHPAKLLTDIQDGTRRTLGFSIPEGTFLRAHLHLLPKGDKDTAGTR